MVSREQILAALINQLEPNPAIHAMWEAGSAAFDRLDQYSDLDIMAELNESLPAPTTTTSKKKHE